MTQATVTTIGEIARQHPLATRVFARHGIDFCCGGGRPLADVCAEKGLDYEGILAEIEKETASDGGPSPRDWGKAPLGELIDHILKVYHAPLYEELPRIFAMAKKVHDVHGDKDPERLRGILEVFHGLKQELEQHFWKEEQVLFPMIRAGRGAMAGGPVSVMEHEHDGAGQALARLSELTDEYTPPAEACNTWRALYHGLGALERSLHEHIHLENNILFPRALAGER